MPGACVDRILSHHAVHQEQGIGRGERAMNMPDLRHHLFIDVQSPGRIDDEHVGKTGPGVFQRRFGDSHGLLPALPRH